MKLLNTAEEKINELEDIKINRNYPFSTLAWQYVRLINNNREYQIKLPKLLDDDVVSKAYSPFSSF